jgi:P27 family predicted phage terminase small subunit
MSKKRKGTPAPAGLSSTMRAWWRGILDTFELESHHRKILEGACRSWDTQAAAQRAIDENGLTYVDRFGTPRARPEVAIARDARIAFSRLVRELGLDIDAPETPRPPRLGGQRY